MLDIKIVPGASRPLYRQIIDQVRRAVASGNLAIGDPLPSVRNLAGELVINQNTVAKAYGELVRDGVVESRHGLGVFVAKRRAVYSKAERRKRFNEAAAIFLTEVLALDYTPEQIRTEIAEQLDRFVSTKQQ